MKVWLDDIREPPSNEWHWAKNIDDAWLSIEYGDVTEISLDHDLGDGEASGYDLIAQIEYMIGTEHWDYPIPQFFIHSANPVGRRAIQAAIDSIERLVSA